MSQTVVIAIGGNAITKHGQKGTVEEQMQNIRDCCDPILDLVQAGYRIVLTHGNGPQVGSILIQNEAAQHVIPVNPLDVCGAQTQGSLGYLISQALYNRMKDRGMAKEVTTIITQVVVDRDDPNFRHPTKPVGPFYTREQAEELERAGFAMMEDSGRGYRRVVPTPRPLEIIEHDTISELLDSGSLVIAVGGGGIPVVRENGRLSGIEAVIDKDLASALLAEEIGADVLLILTGVEKVAVDYGKPTQRDIDRMTAAEARALMAEGQFPPGSMGPKIDAVCGFVEQSGRDAIITSLDRMKDAVEGRTGTRVTAN